MTVASPPLTKRQFVGQINRACRKEWGHIFDNWFAYRRTQNPKLSKETRFSKAVKLSLTAGITVYIFDSMYRLGAPRGQERQIEGIIGSMQSATERIWKGLVPASSVALVSSLYGPYNQRASRYGLTDCLVDKARLKPLES